MLTTHDPCRHSRTGRRRGIVSVTTMATQLDVTRTMDVAQKDGMTRGLVQLLCDVVLAAHAALPCSTRYKYPARHEMVPGRVHVI